MLHAIEPINASNYNEILRYIKSRMADLLIQGIVEKDLLPKGKFHFFNIKLVDKSLQFSFNINNYTTLYYFKNGNVLHQPNVIQ